MERNGAREMEERMCIRETGRALKKYGSTAKHITRNENLFKHPVSSTDTLQGIALKYGVTTEQIRRVNRLWASDSLFLREHLLIPVNPESPLSLENSEETEHNLIQSVHLKDPNIIEERAECNCIYAKPIAEITDAYQSPTKYKCSWNKQFCIHVSSPSSIASSIDDDSSVNDFLAKMDSSIANAKREVKRTQGNSEFCSEDSDIYVQPHRTSSKLRNSLPLSSSAHSAASASEQIRPSSSGDAHNFPTAVVMTQGRKVKTSLQRLQQQQDEIFQL